jgi:hypothetical protein
MGRTTTQMLYQRYAKFIPNVTRRDGAARDYARVQPHRMHDLACLARQGAGLHPPGVSDPCQSIHLAGGDPPAWERLAGTVDLHSPFDDKRAVWLDSIIARHIFDDTSHEIRQGFHEQRIVDFHPSDEVAASAPVLAPSLIHPLIVERTRVRCLLIAVHTHLLRYNDGLTRVELNVTYK